MKLSPYEEFALLVVELSRMPPAELHRRVQAEAARFAITSGRGASKVVSEERRAELSRLYRGLANWLFQKGARPGLLTDYEFLAIEPLGVALVEKGVFEKTVMTEFEKARQRAEK